MMHERFLITLLIAVFAVFPSCIQAQADQDKREIRAITPPEAYPYFVYDSQGNASGLLVEMWRRWADGIDANISFEPMGIDEGLIEVSTGRADLHIGVFGGQELLNDLVRGQPYYGVAIALYHRIGEPPSRERNRIAMRPNMKFAPETSRFLPNSLIDPVYVATEEEALMLVERGDADGALITPAENAAEYLLAKGLDNTLTTQSLLNGFSLVYPVFSASNSSLVAEVDKGLDELSRDWLTQNESKFISNSEYRYFSSLSSVIRLTAQEQEFINDHSTIRVLFPRDSFGPFYFREADKIVGMDLDLLDRIGDRTGLNFEIIGVDSWSDALIALENKEADLITSVGENEQRREFLIFSNPYYEVSHAIIARREVSYRSLSDLREKLVAIPRNWSSAELLRSQNPDIRLLYTESVEEALQLVSNGNVDAYVGNLLNATFEMDRANLTNLKVATPVSLGGPPLSIAMRDDWPQLRSIVNKGLSTISPAELTSIKNRWFKVQYDFGVDRVKLFRAIGFFGLIITGIFLGIFIWNQRLRREVKARLIVEEKLIAAREAAEAAAAAKSNFLATMSHEIRTPLNGVLGMVDILSRTRLDEQQRDGLKTVQASGNSLLEILNDVLDFSKIDAGKLELESVPSNLDQVILNAVKIMRPVASKNNLSIEVVNHTNLQQGYRLDPTRVRQVVLNLVGNAVKFSESGVIKVEIAISEESASCVVIQVIDQGVGIPEDKLNTIFDPFEQAEQSTTRQYGGTGLGLSISRRLAKLMDGDLTLTQNSPKGTIATFSFYAPECDLPIEEDRRQIESIVFEPAKILLADDHQTNQCVALAQLHHLGLTADVAGDGIEALEYLDQQAYDLVLSDCHMPRLDGYGLVKAIREREQQAPGGEKTIVVAVTANAIDGEMEHCLQVGFDDFLSKPFGIEDLVDVLKKYIPIKHQVVSLDQAADAVSKDLQNPTVDFSEVKALVGDGDEFRGLIIEFVKNAFEDISKIVVGIRLNSTSEVQSAAHRVKGTAAMVGAISLGEVAKRIDNAAKASDQTACALELDLLLDEWAQFLRVLNLEFSAMDFGFEQYEIKDKR